MTRLACAAAVVGVSLVLFPLAGTDLRAETNTLPFYENFEPTPPAPEPGGGWGYQAEWHAYDAPANHWVDCLEGTSPPDLAYCPTDPSVVFIEATSTWGPYKMESWPDKDNGGKVFSGQRSARQPIWDPMWSALYHIFTPPVGTGDLRLKVQFWDEAGKLCDCDQEAIRNVYPGYVCDCSTNPEPPYPPPPLSPIASRPNFDDNGGIELTNPYRTEYFAMGVNTHRSWTHYCWVTKADGWVVSTVPRTKAWHRMEIVVHPYTGNAGDVEFLINGVVIAQGHRMPGAGAGVDLSYLRLGGDPAIITENSRTNTFEEFWYDEVALTNCNQIRPDADGDSDVDQDDFGLFQTCLTGSGNPFYRVPTIAGWDNVNHVWLAPILFDAAQCQCMDLDGDQDVDLADFDRFVACASGPAVPAVVGCDNLP